MTLKARLINRSSVEVVDWDKEEANHKNKEEWLCQFKPFIPSPAPELEALEAVLPVYELINGAIVQKWESAGADMHRVATRIKDLKQQLAGSDYLIIKYQEAQITGEDPGWGIIETIKERKQMREEINKLMNFNKI